MNRAQRREADRNARRKPKPHERRTGAPTVLPLAMAKKTDPVLHTATELVMDDEQESTLAAFQPRMRVTCRHREGLALAAPQVGIALAAVCVYDGTVWLNPQVRVVGDETETALEGCLSTPGRWYMVKRAMRVEVVARRVGNREAERFQVTGMEARMWQHEADHLRGVCVWDDHDAVKSVVDLPLPTGAKERLYSHDAALSRR